MSSPPVVSIVIPTYNHAQFVLATLESVWAQTFADYEVIVVNDGSPDNTAAVLEPLARTGRIRYIEQANGGQARARNTGIGLARGAFIALLDDDDLWPPDKLAWQVAALQDDPDAAVVYGKAFPIDADGKPSDPTPELALLFGGNVSLPEGDVFDSFWTHNHIVSPGQSLIRASFLAKIGGEPFDPRIRGCDDWDVWLRLSRDHRFRYQNTVALHYRLHAHNASRDLTAMYLNALTTRRKHYQAGHPDPVIRERLKELYTHERHQVAWFLHNEARQHLGPRRRFLQQQALRLEPTLAWRLLPRMGVPAALLPPIRFVMRVVWWANAHILGRSG